MSGPGCLAAPLVFRAPSGPAARVVCLARPGCLVCPWAAARPRDRHTRAFGSEWSISKPALALLPSGALRTGGACGAVCRLEAQPGPVAAHGYRSLALRHPGLAVLLLVAPLVFWRRRARPPARSPHTSLRLGVVDLEARPGPPDPPAPSTLASLVSLCVVELPLEARSCPAPREIATHEPSARSGRSRSPPVPSGPSGALHTGGACAVVCRLEARPGPAVAHGYRS